jgi:hypothetical protein
MLTDSFQNDLKFFHKLLTEKTPFALTRFGDGERGIIEGNPVGNSEFQYKNNNEFIRKELKYSFQLNFPNYYVGIPCPCCQPKERCEYMKKLSNLPDDKLTWANIFVNHNFKYFNDKIVPSLNGYEFICFVGHGKPDNLPFRVDKFYNVHKNAHINNVDLLDEIPKMIKENEINNGLFLISAGPFANILTARLYEFHTSNTFIDVGSVFDVYQGLGETRGYLQNGQTINKICIW